MYAQFFGLQQAPFSIAPDPRYLFMSDRHREALAHLLYGVGGGGGFVLLSGEIGAGKTTICRCFLDQVPDGCQVAYVFNPRLTVDELLQSVCQEFGVAVPAAAGAGAPSAKACIDALNAHLLAAHALGRHCVLIIDEAQNLTPEVLEQLRLLTNLETAERKLLQIMLIGQPELRDMLARPELEQLAQRVIARYHLGALSAPETAAYLMHRLAVAGRQGPSPFDTAALRRIHQISAGVPRRINLLADRALLGAYAQGRAQVGRRIVDRAAREVFDLRRSASVGAMRARRAAWATGMLALLAGVGWAGWRLGQGAPDRSGVAGPAFGTGVGAAATGSPVPLASGSVALAPAASASTGASAATTASVAGASGAAGAAEASTASAAVLSMPPASAAAAPTALAVAGQSASASAARPAVQPAAAASAPASVPALAAPGDAARQLAQWPSDEQAGWRELAALWGAAPLAPGSGDLCAALREQGLRCHRRAGATPALLRQLDRPVLLPLQVGGGPPRMARLLALSTDRVMLAQGQQTLAVPLADFSRWWRGEFSTLWRAPAGYQDVLQPGARGPAADALARALASVAGDAEPPPGQVLAGAVATRLAAFQATQGLRPDGLAGPSTFMRLNRATGVAEPRLATATAER